MSRLYCRQIIYGFVLMSSNLHRLSPSKPQSTLLSSICHCSYSGGSLTEVPLAEL